MELGHNDIIKQIVLTPKSTDLYKKFRKITLDVHPDANKIMIRGAVEKVWDVKVDNVRVITVPGKTRRYGKKSFKSSDRKKAIITLKSGYSIDLPGQYESTQYVPSQAEMVESGGK